MPKWLSLRRQCGCDTTCRCSATRAACTFSKLHGCVTCIPSCGWRTTSVGWTIQPAGARALQANRDLEVLDTLVESGVTPWQVDVPEEVVLGVAQLHFVLRRHERKLVTARLVDMEGHAKATLVQLVRGRDFVHEPIRTVQPRCLPSHEMQGVRTSTWQVRQAAISAPPCHGIVREDAVEELHSEGAMQHPDASCTTTVLMLRRRVIHRPDLEDRCDWSKSLQSHTHPQVHEVPLIHRFGVHLLLKYSPQFSSPAFSQGCIHELDDFACDNMSWKEVR
mmetsp:Transcript_19029/g.44399  ORF Transcript_19029/g.44399 Transcript_19029/m.44399 type:complete len:278 (-) Transcript_19029:580-1413(-)